MYYNIIYNVLYLGSPGRHNILFIKKKLKRKFRYMGIIYLSYIIMNITCITCFVMPYKVIIFPYKDTPYTVDLPRKCCLKNKTISTFEMWRKKHRWRFFSRPCRCFTCGSAAAAARCSSGTSWAAPTTPPYPPTWSVEF